MTSNNYNICVHFGSPLSINIIKKYFINQCKYSKIFSFNKKNLKISTELFDK
ncbi:hypothetical protein F280043A3_24440 [Intestinibacter bartlettii]